MIGTASTVITDYATTVASSGDTTTLTFTQVQFIATTLSITVDTTSKTVDPLLQQGYQMANVASPSPSTKSEDLEWFASNPPELRPHKDKFVAISRKIVIGSGRTPDKALKEAKQKMPNADPLIIFVGESHFGL